MKKIKNNQIVFPLIFALSIVIIFHIVKSLDLIKWECTANYLNPWQHAFSCIMFYLPVYAAVFIIAFLTAYIIRKRR